jgi:nicotinamidase-related amidase
VPNQIARSRYIVPIQRAARRGRIFEDGAWGGAIRAEFGPRPADVVALEHWCSSGFANTDLDQQRKAHGIDRLIVIGVRANTCVEATVRFAAELGYDVTVVETRGQPLGGRDARHLRGQAPELRPGEHGRDRRVARDGGDGRMSR